MTTPAGYGTASPEDSTVAPASSSSCANPLLVNKIAHTGSNNGNDCYEDDYRREKDANGNYFEDCDTNPRSSGPTSEGYISKNLDYTDRDADGNPKMKETHRTWTESYVHWRPCMIITAFGLLSTLSATLVGPMIPFLLSAYYGGGESGRKDAASTQTLFDSVRALIAFLAVPVYGKLLDSVGRRPFFIMQGILSSLAPAFLFAIPRNPLWYLFFSELAQVFSATYMIAFVTDCYEEKDRARVIAIQQGASGLGSLVALLAPDLDVNLVLILAIAAVMCRIPIAFFFVKETLPREQRRQFHIKYLNPNPLPLFRIIWNQKVLRAITVIVAALMVTSIGTTEILSYYLMQRVNFTKKDLYQSTLEQGLLMPFYLLLVFPVLSRRMRPTRLVFLSLTLLLAGIVILMCINKAWMVFALVFPLVMAGELGVPANIGMFTNAGDRGNQGQRNAGIYAVMDLIGALTPLAIGQIFKALPEEWSWTAFLICLAFGLPTLPVVWHWLPQWVAADREEQIQRSFAAHQRILKMGGDDVGAVGPDNEEPPLTIQDIARLAAEHAEGKDAPVV